MLDLKGANIVILANHAPSVLTPEWIKDKKILTEEPKQSFINPTFSLFESEHFVFTVEPVRLQLSAKAPSEGKYLKCISDALVLYVENFKGLPYKAVGLNFIWEYIHEKVNNYEIKTQIQYLENETELIDIFEGSSKRLGSIVYVENSPYRLRMIIEPTNINSFKLDFNYHYDTSSVDIESIKNYLREFEEKANDSKSIANKIFGEHDE